MATIFAIVLNVFFLATLLASGTSRDAMMRADVASSLALAVGVFFWTLRAARVRTSR